VQTPEKSLGQLDKILNKCGLKPPFLFVGHSYGGILSQLYTLNHPKDVQGIILVDSAIESLLPEKTPPPAIVSDHLPPAAQSRIVNNNRGHFLEEKTAIVVHQICEKSSNFATVHEQENGLEQAAQLLQQKVKENKETPLFSCPLTVIGRGLADGAKNWDEWQIEQPKLTARSSKGKYTVAENSDHFVMYHEPELIQAQIEDMVKQLKIML
jgi:pimeloyl-ACP methyl ester carboxylesterase